MPTPWQITSNKSTSKQEIGKLLRIADVVLIGTGINPIMLDKDILSSKKGENNHSTVKW